MRGYLSKAKVSMNVSFSESAIQHWLWWTQMEYSGVMWRLESRAHKVRAGSWWNQNDVHTESFLAEHYQDMWKKPDSWFKRLSPAGWTLSQSDLGLSNVLKTTQCSLHLSVKDHDRTHWGRGWGILVTRLTGTSYHLYQ